MNDRTVLLRKRRKKQLKELNKFFLSTDKPLEKLTKKQLIELLYAIHCEARDFYVTYQGWEWSKTDGFDQMRDDAFFEAWEKLNDIMQWADGQDLDTIPKIKNDDF